MPPKTRPVAPLPHTPCREAFVEVCLVVRLKEAQACRDACVRRGCWGDQESNWCRRLRVALHVPEGRILDMGGGTRSTSYSSYTRSCSSGCGMFESHYGAQLVGFYCYFRPRRGLNSTGLNIGQNPVEFGS